MKIIRLIGKIVFGVFGLIGIVFTYASLSMRKGWIKRESECNYSYHGPWSWLNKFKK